MAAPILRRALLYVPGSSKRMLEKSRALKNVDCVIYDLEDSVTKSQKATARESVRHILSQPRAPGIREQAVRINSLCSKLAEADLEEVLKAPNIDAIVIPKCEGPEDLDYVADWLHTMKHPNRLNIKFLALIESARAIMDIQGICSGNPRLDGLIFAAEDFALDLSLTRTPSLTEFLFARQTIVAAARAYHCSSAIDLVCTEYKDVSEDSTLARECINGAGMGFNGKQVIHPGQVELVQKMFSPRGERLKNAVRILIAERKAELEGRGSWGLDGKMVDKPVIEAARNIVEKAKNAGTDVESLWEEFKDIVPE
ncbi:hypothetical protein RUND412_004960 [Rhizina undulata]